MVPLRERTFGELISLTFSLVVKHFGKLFVIWGILGLPWLIGLIGLIVLGAGEVSTDTGNIEVNAEASAGEPLVLLGWILFLFLLLLYLLLLPVAQGASIIAVSSSFTGEQRSIGQCLRAAFRKFGAYVLFSIASGVIMFLGYLCLIIPGIIFTTWYYMGWSALLVEDLRAGETLRRSKDLSEGFRWQILGFMIVMGAFSFAVTMILQLFATLVTGVFPSPVLAQILQYFAQLPGTMLGLVAPVVFYFNVRVIKEALDVEQLGSLVDAIAEREQGSGAGAAEATA